MAEIAKMSADEQWAYQMSLKHKRDYNNVMRTARELGLEQGREQGREEGVKRGREEGVKQGIEQGLEQGVHQRSREVAQAMLKADESIDKIIAYSGLTKAQILELKR